MRISDWSFRRVLFRSAYDGRPELPVEARAGGIAARPDRPWPGGAPGSSTAGGRICGSHPPPSSSLSIPAPGWLCVVQPVPARRGRGRGMSRVVNVRVAMDVIKATCAKNEFRVSEVETLVSGGTRVVMLDPRDADTFRLWMKDNMIEGAVTRQAAHMARK